MHTLRISAMSKSMTSHWAGWGKFLAALLVTTPMLLPMSARAQQVLDVPYPPDYTAVDENGVDMVSGTTRFNVTGVSIGAGSSSLTHSIFSDPYGFLYFNPFVDSFSGGLGIQSTLSGSYSACAIGTVEYMAGIGGAYERFCLGADGQFESVLKNGSTLIDYGEGIYIYTKRDGSFFKIDSSYTNVASNWGNRGMVTEGRFPDGRVIQVHHKAITYFNPVNNANPTIRRIQSVTLNNGLQLKYVYLRNATPTDSSTARDWQRVAQVVAVNNAVEYCDPDADTCVFSQAWPTASYSWSADNLVLTVTDSAGRVTRYTHDIYSRVTGIKPPSSASQDKINYDHCPHIPSESVNCRHTICAGGGGGDCTVFSVLDRVRGSVKDGQAWTYEFTTGVGSGNLSIYESFHPVGGRLSFMSDGNSGILRQADDRFGKRHLFGQDKTNRLIQTNELSGATLAYTYDDRGNVLTIRNGVTGDAAAPLLFSAGYPAACDNPVTCNQPLWTKDANGNQTDYTYDSSHGGVLTVTAPAVNGVRPQTRSTYTQRYAWFKDASGAYVQAAEPIWLLESRSSCKTGAALGVGCAIAGDEVLTTFEYGPDSGPNNLFLRGQVVTADGQSLRTCYGNDKYGNRISETQPAAQLASCP